MTEKIEQLLHDLQASNDREHEIAFEEALLDAVLFCNEESYFEVDSLIFLPVFTSLEKAKEFGMDMEYIRPIPLQSLKLKDHASLIINPDTDSVVVDSFTLAEIFDKDDSILIENADTKAILILMQLKEYFESTSATKATLAKIVRGRSFQYALVIGGMTADEIQNHIDPILTIFNNQPVDIYHAKDPFAKTISKNLKPFYTN